MRTFNNVGIIKQSYHFYLCSFQSNNNCHKEVKN